MARTSKQKYHIKGINKNKEIKAERKKPIPNSLMWDIKEPSPLTEESMIIAYDQLGKGAWK